MHGKQLSVGGSILRVPSELPIAKQSLKGVVSLNKPRRVVIEGCHAVISGSDKYKQ